MTREERVPVYEFKCFDCASEADEHRAAEDRDDPKECVCGSEMKRMFSPISFNMPKLNYTRQVEENRKRADALGVGNTKAGADPIPGL